MSALHDVESKKHFHNGGMATPTVHAKRKVRILIADNNKNLSYVLKQELEDAGYAVDSVFDGVDAVHRVIDHNDYGFVLLDVLLPKLDGLNTLKLIKKIKPNVNIIAVSESMPFGDKTECLNAGANICFTKPCKIKTIKNYISGQIAAKNGKDMKAGETLGSQARE